LRLIWSKTALRDLAEIADYIGSDSPKNAELVEARIQQESELIGRFPHSGRSGRMANTRERVVRRTPYILVYQIKSDTVRILHVFRGRRKWPSSI
jgi:toxin ParE1/3/4